MVTAPWTVAIRDVRPMASRVTIYSVGHSAAVTGSATPAKMDLTVRSTAVNRVSAATDPVTKTKTLVCALPTAVYRRSARRIVRIMSTPTVTVKQTAMTASVTFHPSVHACRATPRVRLAANAAPVLAEARAAVGSRDGFARYLAIVSHKSMLDHT